MQKPFVAIILAAGMGKRLNSGSPIPKGLQVKLPNGVSLIERSILMLHSVGIRKFIICTGYGREHYQEFMRFMSKVLENSEGVEFVEVPNSQFSTTGSFYTMHIGINEAYAKYKECNAIVLESDILYETSALTKSMEMCERLDAPFIVSADKSGRGDEVLLSFDDVGYVLEASKKDPVSVTELMGITAINNSTVTFMNKMYSYERLRPDIRNSEYETVIANTGLFRNCHIPDLLWCEVDRPEDYPIMKDIYEKIRRKTLASIDCNFESNHI